MSSNFKGVLDQISFPKTNKEVFFLIGLIFFCIFVRVVPLSLITIISISVFLFLIIYDFYLYVNFLKVSEEDKKEHLQYNWASASKTFKQIPFEIFLKYVYQKDLHIIKFYLEQNAGKFLLILFIFGDLLVAFKGLDLINAGVYISMSLFCKFVFLGYFILDDIYQKNKTEQGSDDEKILEIFNTHTSTLISIFIAIFIFIFILSKTMIDIFFGEKFLPFHTSLPFLLLANMTLVISLVIYRTASLIDKKITQKISRTFFLFFVVLFIFMSIGYVDTVAYFIIGSSTLLSIFLYNFVIKKPSYIGYTYNHFF